MLVVIGDLSEREDLIGCRLLRGFGVAEERITELNWTDSVTIAGEGAAELRLTAVPARHFSGRALWNRFETLWSSFVLVGARHRVFYGADSGIWEKLAGASAFNLFLIAFARFRDSVKPTRKLRRE